MDGFLNVLKPPGMSSHDVVGTVRRILRLKRVGHGGTLDPAAAGVLPIAVGRATRLAEYLASSTKSYRAEILLGRATDSGDALGRITEEWSDVPMPSEMKIREVLKGFLGKISQRPPAFSAIKVKGQKACDMARKEIPVNVPPRQVEIYSMELLSVREEEKKFLLDVECSKGTYIRSLCMDIGARLGVPAVLSFLLRTRTGDFRLTDSCTLEELETMGEVALLAPESCLSYIPLYELSENRIKAFCNGLPTGDTKERPSLLRVYGGGDFLGIGRYDPLSRAVYPVKVYKEK